ncbi:hypothetical protein IWW36_001944 [Coemansia brasiliensis]|uniref:Matrin-type domain-containing protein n=1 Tax=Coemansia brasiliensis TaxID=2650707 RepID=A0A9W8M144_9FUNG|nr:hypothetical protein IWW36_001944 [Coemansia brasiliensis]
MSSYKRKAPWDRNNKYWCDYCRIYVYDNRTSRNQHESGAKHKDNVQKYLRKMGKDADAKEQAEKQLNAQLAKIEQAAAKSFQKDMGTAHSTLAAAAPTITAPKPKSSYHKPAQSEKQSEAAAPVQSSRPAHMGIIGEWEVVQDPMQEASGPIAPHDDLPPSPTGLRGEELLDEEDQQPQQMAEFEIKEKTVAVSDTDCKESTPVFKKRRTPASRSTRKRHK